MAARYSNEPMVVAAAAAVEAPTAARMSTGGMAAGGL